MVFSVQWSQITGPLLMATKKETYFFFKFKLFWAAIFSSMLFFIVHAVCTLFLSPSVGTRAAVSSIRCELWFYVFSPSNVLSLSSTSDIWLNVHLHSNKILTFSIFFLLASAIFSWNYGWMARMNGTRKCQNAYRHCIIIIIITD